MFRPRVPLAWKNLTHDPRRLVLAAAGIGFAVLLMFMQTGFRGALYDSTVQLPLKFRAELVITSTAKNIQVVKQMFPRQRLLQALECDGVAAAYPLYVEQRAGLWRNPDTRRGQVVRVIALDPRLPILNLPAIAQHAAELLLPDTLLFDHKSKPEMGDIVPGTVSELSGHRVRVVDTFDLGTDFTSDGSVILSLNNYQRFFFPPQARAAALAQVDYGLIKLADGADAERVRTELAHLLPNDVKVQTIKEVVSQEQEFWSQCTPIGYIFGFGAVLGFVVGMIICYQILFADITDHLPEYATLKAMGYRPSYFVVVVLAEALWLSVFGFFPGLLVAEGLYVGLAEATGLLMQLTLARAGLVLLLTVTMCVASGCLAMRKVLTADPAELFR